MEFNELIKLPFGTKLLIKAFRYRSTNQVGFYDLYQEPDDESQEQIEIETKYLGYCRNTRQDRILVENNYHGWGIAHKLHLSQFVVDKKNEDDVQAWYLNVKFVIRMIYQIQYGFACIECKDYNGYAVANYGDRYICYSCRKTYMWRHADHIVV